jgi:superfamily II DNA or RNA helicase
LDAFFNKNKKFVLLEAPVGTGKSFIASTISNYINSLNSSYKSYILVTQIILQNQYKR